MRFERGEIEILEIGRRGLQNHLELIVMLHPVGVLAIAAVLGPAAGLRIGGAPGLGPERAQGGGGVKGARAHLHVVGLQDHAALLRPIALQGQDQTLKGFGRREGLVRLDSHGVRSALRSALGVLVDERHAVIAQNRVDRVLVVRDEAIELALPVLIGAAHAESDAKAHACPRRVGDRGDDELLCGRSSRDSRRRAPRAAPRRGRLSLGRRSSPRRGSRSACPPSADRA